MAEIDSGGGGGKKGPKKVSTKVDMTPMVDLAFLLITFFMLTTTFSKPQIMEVNMPDQGEDAPTTKTKESTTITFVLDKEDRVLYWQGIEDPSVFATNFSEEKGLRTVLLKKKDEIRTKTGEDIVVILKARNEARYKNVVDVLDEMSITGITRYALVDYTPADEELLKKRGF